ncbi:MAG: hypothetical protein HKN23_14500 [Verrucomicrobiales bacterium]|nr:hypothetical protein [Verrucomicrobiales bacterium]
MLRFNLFGYPVRVHWMFWILCIILGMGYLQQRDRQGPISFLIVTAVVFGSILWHELGHAWARKRCGANYSEIELHGMGGLCGGPGYLTRKQSMFVSAMGPAASMLLGAVIFPLKFTPGMDWVMDPTNPGFAVRQNISFAVFVNHMIWVNIGWALLNLLPVMPLDGGQIFNAFMANKNPALVPRVGMIVAGIVAILGLLAVQLWMAFIFGFLAYQNYRRMQGTHSGFW